MIKKQTTANKQQIISEYLTGNQSYEALSKKHGVKLRTIQSWVRAFRLKQAPLEHRGSETTSGDIKDLKKQLKLSQLKNELLEEMLRLSEEQSGIDFRKKFGARQS